MKKIYASFVLVLAAAMAIGQNLTLSQNTVDLAIGEYIDYQEIFITNNGQANIEVAVALNTVCYDPTDGLKLQVCLGAQCFEPVNVNSSWGESSNTPVLELAPGESSGLISVHQFFTGTMGSEWELTFFDRNNPSDDVVMTLTVGTCAVTNVSDLPTLETLGVYPNPAQDFVQVSYSVSTQPASLIIFDLVGNTVVQEQLENNVGKTRIDVSGLNNGVYFYRLVAGAHESAVKSLVVSH